jgi:long-chain acyl-CoA synthetase
MDLCLTQALHRAVRQHPKKIVTIHGQRRQDYATMRHRVACLASALRALGVAPGDRVAILSLNSDRYAEYYFAVYWAGGVVNPVNVRWSAAEIAYSLNDCDTRILFIDDPFLPMLLALRQQAACLNTVIHCGDGATPAQSLSYETLIADHAPVEDARRGGEDLAGVFYTGGTTGFPKGVMLSHRALYLNALELMTHGIDASHGIGLHAAPMFHLADHVMFNALFIGGGTHVMLSMFDPKRVAETIEREGVSMTLMVPIMIQALVDSEPAHEHDMSSLKELLYGGAPMNEAVIDRTLARLPQARMCQAYGMTELAAIATILPHYYHSKEARSVGKCRSAGLPSAICEMRIVDKDGNEASRGTVGEVAVRSPCAMQGYWNKPELTRQALRGGWMHTGDGGYMDADGFIFIVDRLKDMIITGGENVYSVEVENAVATHDAVLQCATIAVPDEQWGELVHVCVVLRPGATLDLQSLHAHCVPLIANYKIPRSLEILEKLPVSGAGKVLKSKLREKYWSGIGRNVG